MSRLHRLHRLAAALTAALLLQLTLLGSGTLCAVQGQSFSGTMTGMAGMQRADHASARLAGVSVRSESPPTTPGAPHPCERSGPDSGCGLPWAPGQCGAMTTCAASAAPAGEILVQVSASSGVSELPEPAAIVSGLTDAPELPPPRA